MVVIFSGSETSKLDEVFGHLPVWLAAENGVYVRPPAAPLPGGPGGGAGGAGGGGGGGGGTPKAPALPRGQSLPGGAPAHQQQQVRGRARGRGYTCMCVYVGQQNGVMYRMCVRAFARMHHVAGISPSCLA